MLRQGQVIALLALSLSACGPSAAPDVPTVTISDPVAPPALVSATPTSAPSAAPRGAGPIAWEESELTARDRARVRKVPILVFVGAAWDTAAVRMDRVTWADPRVTERARSFVALRVDATDTGPNAQAAADRFDVKVLPTLVLLDEAGREIGRIEGYAEPDAVLAAMERAASNVP